MNKRFASWIAALLLAVTSFSPMTSIARADHCGTCPANGQITDSVRINFINTFNARVVLFDQSVQFSLQMLGQQRLFQLMSAGLGIPVHVLETNFEALGLPLNQFFMAQILAHSTNLPVQVIVDRVNLGQTFGEIGLALGVPLNLTLQRVDMLIGVFAFECGIANNVIQQGSLEQQLAELDNLLKMADARMQVFIDRLGENTFNQIFFNRLALETGLATDILFTARVNIPRNISLAQFGAAVLVEDSLEGAIRFVLENNDMALLTPYGIIGANNGQALPIQLFTQRIAIFMDALDADVDSTGSAQ